MTVEEYKSLELDMIRHRFCEFTLDHLQSPSLSSLRYRLILDCAVLHFNILRQMYPLQSVDLDLSSADLESQLLVKPLSVSSIHAHCEEMLFKYYAQDADFFITAFEQKMEVYMRHAQDLPHLALWLRLLLLKFYLAFNHNKRFQNKIVHSLRIVKKEVGFSPNLQFRVACLEVQFLVQAREFVELFSLLNNLYFFESFPVQVTRIHKLVCKVFNLDNLVVHSIIDKLMIFTNYEIYRCQITPERDSFVFDFWLYAFTQVENVEVADFQVKLRTDRR